MVSPTLKEYEVVTEAMINQEKSVGLLFDTWKGRPMPTDSVVGHWMEELVKLLGVEFNPDLQVDKNWGEVTDKVASLP